MNKTIKSTINKTSNKSIKNKTAFWYTYLYLIIAIATLLMLGLTIFTISYNSVYKTSNKIENKVTKVLSNMNSNDAEGEIKNLEKKLTKLEKKYSNTDIAIVNTYGNFYYASKNKAVTNYLKNLKSNILFSLIPKVSLLDKGYLISTRNIVISNDVHYKLIIFYSKLPLIQHFTTIFLPIALILTLGALVMLILGRMQLGKVLSPINKMTKTTREITAENLDIRLDVSNTEYELKELAQTTNEMIDSFQNSYERQERFVSDVSHELRTPISVISGYANMLQRWGSNDKEILEESVNSIIFETENMKNMVNRLLFLAKHDKRNLTYNMESLNLSNLADTIIRDYEVSNSDVKIISKIEDSIEIYADEFRIIEVVRTIVDNAIKYSNKDNSIIEINLQKEGKSAILSIKDNGIGMKDKDLKNVFDRFYRSDESRNKETGGMGLGLSIAKAIVLDHGGKIIVRTKENKGSEFKIYLPLA